MQHADICIVGGGIVGAATAVRLIQAYPQHRIHLLEKEAQPAMHQTGRNSGVIHAGVYYQPGSLKAKYSREGLQRTIHYCRQHGLPYQQCGKLLVATNAAEMARMDSLYHRCIDNELSPTLLDAAQLRQREPNVRGLGAIWVRDTGIVDYAALTRHLLQRFVSLGGQVWFSRQVQQLTETERSIVVQTNQGPCESGLLVNCAGLHSDRLLHWLQQHLDTAIDFSIIPFRGEYYLLAEQHNNIVQHLIYPIPDPELPFLGVHLTRMINGTVTVGPNAVLALGREAYRKTALNFADLKQMLSFPGFWPMVRDNLPSGLREIKNSIFKAGYLRLVQRYCPAIQGRDLLPYPSGIRAQAVAKDGSLIHDFKFVSSPHSLHVGNAPSPAATSAMPIAEAIYHRCKALL